MQISKATPNIPPKKSFFQRLPWVGKKSQNYKNPGLGGKDTPKWKAVMNKYEFPILLSFLGLMTGVMAYFGFKDDQSFRKALEKMTPEERERAIEARNEEILEAYMANEIINQQSSAAAYTSSYY